MGCAEILSPERLIVPAVREIEEVTLADGELAPPGVGVVRAYRVGGGDAVLLAHEEVRRVSGSALKLSPATAASSDPSAPAASSAPGAFPRKARLWGRGPGGEGPGVLPPEKPPPAEKPLWLLFPSTPRRSCWEKFCWFTLLEMRSEERRVGKECRS